MAPSRAVRLHELSSTPSGWTLSDHIAGVVSCFIRFNLAGAIGLLADTTVLACLCSLGLNPAIARTLSITAGTAVNWPIDRHFTFTPSHRRPADESSRYFLVALLSQIQNYYIFVGLVYALPNLNHLICVLAGAIWTTGFSFSAQLLFTFAPARSKRNIGYQRRDLVQVDTC